MSNECSGNRKAVSHNRETAFLIIVSQPAELTAAGIADQIHFEPGNRLRNGETAWNDSPRFNIHRLAVEPLLDDASVDADGTVNHHRIIEHRKGLTQNSGLAENRQRMIGAECIDIGGIGEL